MPSSRFIAVLRSPTTWGLVIAGTLSYTATRWLDARLQAGAAVHAGAGRSELAAQFANDWIEAVVPTALASEEPFGSRARRIASARLDRLITRMQGGGSPDEALALLARLRTPGVAFTAKGGDWATWVTQRLVIEARHAGVDRLRLLRAADSTLLALAERPNRGAPPPPPETEEAPAPPLEQPEAIPFRAIAEAPPLPTLVVEPLVATPDRLPEVVATVRPAPVEPPPVDPGWTPEWESAAAVAEDAPLELALTQMSAHQLLQELAEYDAPPPIALGPRGRIDEDTEISPEAQRYLDLRAALAAEGMARVSINHAKRFLSPDFEERIDLIEGLLTSPEADAGPLLLMLAEDADARVRVAAVSALGASTSRVIVERAWRIALNDPDPRVGRLAEGLRQRLR